MASKKTPKIVLWWKKHQFKILVALSTLIILILWKFNEPGQGTYSDTYFFPDEWRYSSQKKRAFPTESKGEIVCRQVIESIFKRSFPKRRPLFLLNAVTGKPLEIDCCNEEIKVGVEYNGKQHYQYVPGMHKNYEAFRNQQYRDKMKQDLCDQNHFHLIIVPYTISLENIPRFIQQELVRKKILS